MSHVTLRSLSPDDLRVGQQVAYVDGYGRWRVVDGADRRIRGSARMVLLSDTPGRPRRPRLQTALDTLARLCDRASTWNQGGGQR